MIICDECKANGEEVRGLLNLNLNGPVQKPVIMKCGELSFNVRLMLAPLGNKHLCQKCYAIALKEIDLVGMTEKAEQKVD